MRTPLTKYIKIYEHINLCSCTGLQGCAVLFRDHNWTVSIWHLNYVCMLRASDDTDQHFCLFLACWSRCITLHRPWHHCEESDVCGSLIWISWARIGVSDDAGFHLSRFLVALLYVDFAVFPFPGSMKREPALLPLVELRSGMTGRSSGLRDTSKAFLDPRLFGTRSSYICNESS